MLGGNDFLDMYGPRAFVMSRIFIYDAAMDEASYLAFGGASRR